MVPVQLLTGPVNIPPSLLSRISITLTRDVDLILADVVPHYELRLRRLHLRDSKEEESPVTPR